MHRPACSYIHRTETKKVGVLHEQGSIMSIFIHRTETIVMGVFFVHAQASMFLHRTEMIWVHLLYL